MPLNLLKKYNTLLDLIGLNPVKRNISLKGIFTRDIEENQFFRFRGKEINPTPKDGQIPMETLFTHLTTTIVDEKSRKREFEHHRSARLHWVKYHIEEHKSDKMLIFSCRDKHGPRTYIYDQTEQYVIILEPYRNQKEYYLLTAFYLRGKNINKLENKYKRRLNELL